jgi:beta-glucosidase
MPRPVKELKAYQRITLQPGEQQTITFHLPVDQLAFYDEALKLCVESGKILVMVGGSSEDIRLRGEFKIAGEQKSFVKERVFSCPVSVQASPEGVA